MQDKSEHRYDMTSIQCRMARAATGLGVRDLAKNASVSPDTIARFERGEELKPATITAIRAALEAAGVEFIDSNGGGAGVRLRKQESGTVRYDLSKREIKALTNLKSECDFAKGDFIVRGKIGTGEKTIENLRKLGLLTTGKCKSPDKEGYQITDEGRRALQQPPAPKSPRARTRLKTMAPRLKPLPSRFNKT